MLFVLGYTLSNEAVAQNCVAFYGATGEPPSGLTLDLCAPNPGLVILDATVISGTATAYTWSSGISGSTTSAFSTGVYTVTVSSFGAPLACVLDFIVTSHPNPIPTLAGNDTAFCAGDSIALSSPTGYTAYIWSDNVTTDDSLLVYAAGTYTVTVTDAFGCLGSDSIAVIQDTLPVPNPGAAVSQCVGDSATFDAGVGFSTYLWSNTDTTQMVSTDIAGVYDVTVTDSNSCSGASQFTFTNYTIPIVNIGADDSLCKGSSKLLDAGIGFNSYLWSDGSIGQTASFSSTSNPWVEVSDGNNCLASDTMHLEINQLPIINLGADDTICASQTYNLNAGNPGGSIASYIWSTGSNNQTISIGANPGLVSDILTVYSVTVTDVNGCVGADTLELATYIIPVPVVGNDTSYCTGDPFSLILDPGIFASYAWSTGAITSTISIGAVPMSYQVTVTDARGCTNDDGLVVTQNAIPTPNLGPDDSYCQGSSFTKILNPGLFDAYLWSDNSSGQILGVSTAGTYGVTVTDANGCSNIDDIIITENATPDVDLGQNVFYCEDVPVNHMFDATTLLTGGGFNFLWNTTETSGVIIATTFGTFTVVVTDQLTNCFATSSVDVIPMEKASPELGDDGLVCQGELVRLDPNVSISGYNYTWSTGATTSTISVFETGLYWVRLDAANGTCIGLTDTVYFSPGVLPVVELGSDQYVCEGQNVTLLNGSTPFPGSTYTWQDGSAAFSFKATETGIYDVEVSNECGSVVDQVYLEFQDCSNFYFPSAFTPNADGRNDIFYPKTDQEFSEYGFWVYDRWGVLMFKTNEPNFGWDGKVDGEYAIIGTYVWRISYVSSYQEFGERVEKSGEFILIR